MALRATGSLMLSFGLINIPIKLFSSIEASASNSFNLLHRPCGGRPRQKYYCPTCAVDTEPDDLVKGYEIAKGRFLPFEKEELDALARVEKSNILEILEFVPLHSIPSPLRDRTYYLGPDKGGAKAYALLAAALERTGLGAVAKYVNRGKQHIVVVHPHEYGLAMVQLHYHDQIRPFSAVEFERESVSEKEIELAVQLVRAQAHDAFDARQYTDEVRERLLDLIRRKEEGADITALATVEPARDNTIDLIAALKASIEATATRQPAAAPPARSKSRKKSA